jgi:Protein of unknown function (DUF3175)
MPPSKTKNAKTQAKKPPAKKAPAKKPRSAKKKWSQGVTETSDAMTLQEGVFNLKTPRAIALSLKRSAESSKRRKSPPFRSAMSMLVFYENRGGKNLTAAERKKLDAAKEELRKLFHKDA